MTRDAKRGDKIIKNTGEIYTLNCDYDHEKDFYVFVDTDDDVHAMYKKMTSFAVSECTIEDYPQHYL